MIYNGSGVPQDYLQASRWYKKAADQNYALAQFNLALMYFDGKGVAKSTEMSYIWNIIAARNGYRIAEKSRDMDEQKLTVEEIKISREKADTIQRNIIQQRELKLRQALLEQNL
jgi:TPR repeat protein